MNDTERMFTQAELDQIITERLRKERVKYQQETQQRAAELDKRERLFNAKADWQKRGLPVDLLDSLDMTREDALETAAAAIANYQRPMQPIMSRGGFEGRHQENAIDPAAPIRAAMGLSTTRKDE